MRRALFFLVAALPLMGCGDTSFWEREADKAPRDKAPELYARAIEAYGDARPPKTADIVRCLEKLPWEAVSAGEFKRLTRRLSPLLRRKHSKAELVAWKKRILTKYRLLQVSGEADVASGEAGYDVPVIQTRTLSLRMAEIRSVELGGIRPVTVEVASSPIERTVIEGVSIPVIDLGDVEVVIVDPMTVDVERATVPQTAIALIRADDSGGGAIQEWRAVQELRFRVMGKHGVFVPHGLTPMGRRYKSLQKRLAEHGPGWRTSSDLVAEWEAYWRAVRRLLDRRERWQERMRYGR
jgi:hypothetical protein